MIEGYRGFHPVGRLLAKLQEITHPETGAPALDAVLLERECLRHDTREIQRPTLHVLFDEKGEHWRTLAGEVRRLASAVGGGGEVICRSHQTEMWLYEQRDRLQHHCPVYASKAFARRVNALD